ncbi:Wdr54 [Symbiodinium natans]|uniref:Wdr54 protein n=1 Tax=Symbiodinium natans TaxID=878477 RepID=A0A812S3W0_9DINO|nr:Wdr54 [Symbiodinium natans]
MAAVSHLTAAASLLHNNLASSSNGWVVAIHNSLNAGHGKLLFHALASGQSKDGPEVTQATSIRFLETMDGPVLVVTSTNGTQIYAEDATALIFYLPVTDAASPDSLRYHQAACFVPTLQHIVVGTSKGTIWPVSAVAAGQYVQLHESAPSSPTGEVADLCYCALADAVVSVHNNGDLRVWSASADAPYTNIEVIPSICQAPVRILSVKAQLALADGPGTILLLDAISREVKAEITAHARWLSAAVSREDSDMGLIVSVGEDTVLNVWQVEPVEGTVSLHHSAVVTDKLLCGVALHGSGASVVAYDSDQLYHVNF